MKWAKKIVSVVFLLSVFTLFSGCDWFKTADETGPVISGAVNITLEVGSSAPNWLSGVTAIDEVDGNLTTQLAVDASDVNLLVVGTYDLVYSVTDESDNDSSVTVSVYVVDTVNPTMAGMEDFTLEVNSSAPNWLTGLTANDSYYGDLTSAIVADDSEVDLTTVGTYTLTYTVEDNSGNEATETVNVVVVDTTDPQINGAQNLFLAAGSETPNWIGSIIATDSYDGNLTNEIVVDDSAVDLMTTGAYTLTYTVADTSDNEASVEVTITVVMVLPQEYLSLDVALLTELTGISPSGETLAMLEAVSVLRAENFGIIFIPGYSIDEATVQDMFIRELTPEELTLIVDYQTYWTNNIGSPTGDGLTPYDVQRIMTSFILGRPLTTEEGAIFTVLGALSSEYSASKGVEDPDFGDATTEEVEAVIGRSLTQDEVDAYAIQDDMYMEMMSGMMMVMVANNLNRGLTYEEMDAFKLMSYVVVAFQSYGGMLPNVEDAQTVLGITFTTEEVAAYEVILGIYQEQIINMMIDQMATEWGRELTEQERVYVATVFELMFEYNAAYTSGVDPELQDATLTQIETVIGRSLTQDEIDSYYYVMSQSVIASLESGLGRSLTTEELAAVPVILMLSNEYATLAVEGIDPVIEEATNEQIEAVIGRSLTQTEIDSLDIFRTLMSSMAA
ncbi:MAG: immunoglobulin-like domain-containing protein [Spirochaetales bacterium]